MIENGVNGWLDEDLRSAALSALKVDRQSCRRFAEGYSWENCSRQFLSHIQPLDESAVHTIAEAAETP